LRWKGAWLGGIDFGYDHPFDELITCLLLFDDS
jgi:hypothetical protein